MSTLGESSVANEVQLPASDLGFARKATGLVREASITDVVAFNFSANWIFGFGFAFSSLYLLTALPGVNLVIACLIATVAAVFICACWAMLSSVVPRTGGDYVINTRILNPTLGFVGSFLTTAVQFLSLGISASWTGPIILSPVFAILGATTGSATLTNWATAVTHKGWQIGLGTAVLVAGGILLAIGLRPALNVIKIVAVTGILGFLLGLASLIFASRSQFETSLQHFRGVNVGPDAYHKIIGIAQAQGLVLPHGINWPHTVAAGFVLGIFITSSFFSAYMNGEIRRGNTLRRQLTVMMIPSVGGGLLLALTFGFMVRVVGNSFLTAVNFLNGTSHYPLPAPPYSQLFPAILHSNSFIGVAVVALFVSWAVGNLLMEEIVISRIMFAWSFDRILPARVSSLNSRSGTPIAAIIICIVGAEICMLAVVNISTIFTWVTAMFLLNFVTYMLIGVAAVVYPYLRQVQFQKSHVRASIAHIPVLVIVGVVTFAWNLGSIVVDMEYPSLGITHWWYVLLELGAAIGLALLFFYGVRAYRQQHGIDMKLIYSEIPPE
jgi:basic amino acid/polyamine antiporter, APA family